MKIYTKGGDKGSTSLLFGTRVSKSELRLEVFGTVDELNAQIGLLVVLMGDFYGAEQKYVLEKVQNRLFDLGSLLAAEKPSDFLKPLSLESVVELEKAMDNMSEELVPLSNFILPGGTKEAAQAHICRTVCRRAERRLAAFGEEEELPEQALPFLNRLSDYFFVLSRYLNKKSGVEDRIWDKNV